MKQAKILLLALSLLLIQCHQEESKPVKPELQSSFENDAFMPVECGKNNGNISPRLNIINMPQGTTELVLTMRDLDNKNSWHWAVWNIPTQKPFFEEGESWDGINVTIGNNDYGAGYVGPFPPSMHRYEIKVYFLKQKITLAPDRYRSLPSAIQNKVLDEATLIGRYE